ncbi:MAG TPA: glycosyltransferase [Bryobacteraceae bacterium]|jgi:spore maturation protein CgeB|nr:glycosyltransferase [Bryobacteraceae bacterium]
MRIAFFGSSLVSAYWNGAATYYRGIIRALAARGHQITFYEPDAWDRQQHRDIADPDWARVVVYRPAEAEAMRVIDEARGADVLVKASGVGVLDEFLESAISEAKSSTVSTVFWDVDAPATLDRIQSNARDPFGELIPTYDAIFTYGGGDPVVRAYMRFGARLCVPIYNGLDPATHFPALSEGRFAGDLGFLGNRLPDREARVDEFFFHPARNLPGMQFLLGGAGWGGKSVPSNVTYFDHVYTRDHNAFNSTPRMVINISRDSMVRYGYSPATRVFEAAGAAACIITDEWEGIEYFFEPGREILVAAGAEEVAAHLAGVTAAEAKKTGEAAFRRALAQHTYAHRAEQVECILTGRAANAAGAAERIA